MTEFTYTREEAQIIKDRLDLLRGKLLMTEDNSFCLLKDFVIESKELKKTWFSNGTKQVYYISSIELDYGTSTKVHVDQIMCSHISINKFEYMKSIADELFKNLKPFNYTICNLDKINE